MKKIIIPIMLAISCLNHHWIFAMEPEVPFNSKEDKQSLSIEPSLEEQFESHWLVDNLFTEYDRFDYLDVDQEDTQDVKSRLDSVKIPGIIVSAGAKIGFFDLFFAPDCIEGLVFRNISPWAKAYVDFNVLLLRIADTLEEYSQLSLEENRLEVIKQKLRSSEIPIKVKEYYLRNLAKLAEIFFSAGVNWKTSDNIDFSEQVLYDENRPIFTKLQKYARLGNIIATVGDINDLEFLTARTISVIDASYMR